MSDSSATIRTEQQADSTAGFTPGPWRPCGESECACGVVWSIPTDMPVVTVVGEKQHLIGLVNNEWGDAADMIYGAVGRNDQKANAHLISAAPDMYEALVRIEKALRIDAPGVPQKLIVRDETIYQLDGQSMYVAINAARAAIAKAEGR